MLVQGTPGPSGRKETGGFSEAIFRRAPVQGHKRQTGHSAPVEDGHPGRQVENGPQGGEGAYEPP